MENAIVFLGVFQAICPVTHDVNNGLWVLALFLLRDSLSLKHALPFSWQALVQTEFSDELGNKRTREIGDASHFHSIFLHFQKTYRVLAGVVIITDVGEMDRILRARDGHLVR